MNYVEFFYWFGGAKSTFCVVNHIELSLVWVCLFAMGNDSIIESAVG